MGAPCGCCCGGSAKSYTECLVEVEWWTKMRRVEIIDKERFSEPIVWPIDKRQDWLKGGKEATFPEPLVRYCCSATIQSIQGTS